MRAIDSGGGWRYADAGKDVWSSCTAKYIYKAILGYTGKRCANKGHGNRRDWKVSGGLMMIFGCSSLPVVPTKGGPSPRRQPKPRC